MLRKISFVLVFCVCLVVFTSAAQATSYAEPDGYYWVSGSLKLSAKVNGIGSVSMSLTNMAAFGALFYFDWWGDFAFLLPILSEDPLLWGSWYTTTPGKFAVEADLDSLVAMLTGYGVNAYVTSRSFTGQVNADGTIKGKFNVGVGFDVEGYSGTLTLSGSYTGYPDSYILLSEMGVAKPERVNKDAPQKANALAEYIAKFLKSIPANPPSVIK